MGNWTELLLTQLSIMESYRKMEVSSIKAKASTNIEFEDLQKEAVLASIFIAKACLDKLGVKIKYRGLDKLKGKRLAFVSNHQGGNLDGIIIATILFIEKFKVPYIPTSQRLLEAKFIGTFNRYLKYIGPFFIRTSFQDPDYIKEVRDFMDAVLDAKQYLLFFIEGDTSKGGKPLPPRRGLIKSLIHQPITFCPVSLTYESNLNDSGIRKRNFAVGDVIQNLMSRKIGTCYVNFGDCLEVSPDMDHKLVTRELGNRIYSEIPILTCDLIAVILLDRMRGVSRKELSSALLELESVVKDRRLPYIRKSLASSLSAISHLINTREDVISVSQPLTLNFYRNRAYHVFFDLSQPPSLLRYECNWCPPPYLPSATIQTLSQRMVSPLVEAYTVILTKIGYGTTKDKLREVIGANSATTSATLNQILLVLVEEQMITVDGNVILPRTV